MTWTISPKMKAQIEAKAQRQAIVDKQMEAFKAKMKEKQNDQSRATPSPRRDK